MPESGGPRWSGRSRPDGGSRGARSAGRRSGPAGEERWWEPGDQQLAEELLLDRRTLGRGWRPAPMVNNVERLRQLGTDPASEAVESARLARRPTGLDEGRAWRHRTSRSLIVVRSEVYGDDDPDGAATHRVAWQEHAEQALDATWRERWLERDRQPAWIEARWAQPDAGSGALGDACDWLRVEDHTPAVAGASMGTTGAVTVYEHLTVWADRRQVTVVLRHDSGLDLDDVVNRCATAVQRRLSP